MSRRKVVTTTDDVPATVPAVVPPRVEPRADWSLWSADRERRRLEAEMAERAKLAGPIFPVECARALAEDWQTFAPDWRAMRPSLGPAWGKLLKAQPELSRELTRQREALLNALFNSLPGHLRGLVADLRQLIDLLLTGHECAAYLVGFEAGKIAGRRRARDERKASPRQQTASASPLRLHLDE